MLVAFLCGISIIFLGLGMESCGFLGSKGDEPKGDSALPISGVGPFLKEDQDCEEDFLQPIFMDSGNAGIYWGEPLILHLGETQFRLLFEARQGTGVSVYQQLIELRPAPQGSCRSRDVYFLSQRGEPGDGPQPVEVLDAAGAPSVIQGEGIFKIWYEMENGQGIGYAEVLEIDDGFEELVRMEPVLSPSESWESGVIGSPSVLRNEGLGVYQMWYEGNINAQRSIGYATSMDGKQWIKRDALGHTSADHPGIVAPVLVPDQTTWEYHYPVESDSGSIGTPHVILHRTPVRTLYYLYYTGNLRGRAALNLDDVDTSIGLAGSVDGLHWVKASNIQDFGDVAWEVNPILNEVFPLDVVNKLFAELLGEGYKYKIEGSSNVFFPWVIVDEISPCVIDLGTIFYMVFGQTGSLDQAKGLALAVVERK